MGAGRTTVASHVAPGASARPARATATLFALGSLLTLVDALLTRTLLQDTRLIERWVPVRALMEAFGIDVALVLCSTLAVIAMGVVAWGAVRARSTLASLSFFVLCAVVAVRVWGCLNNIDILLG
jgi:hypothetical protein